MHCDGVWVQKPRWGGGRTRHSRGADTGEGVRSVDAASQPAGVRLAVVGVRLASAPREPLRTRASKACGDAGVGDAPGAVQAVTGQHGNLQMVQKNVSKQENGERNSTVTKMQKLLQKY